MINNDTVPISMKKFSYALATSDIAMGVQALNEISSDPAAMKVFFDLLAINDYGPQAMNVYREAEPGYVARDTQDTFSNLTLEFYRKNPELKNPELEDHTMHIRSLNKFLSEVFKKMLRESDDYKVINEMLKKGQEWRLRDVNLSTVLRQDMTRTKLITAIAFDDLDLLKKELESRKASHQELKDAIHIAVYREVKGIGKNNINILTELRWYEKKNYPDIEPASYDNFLTESLINQLKYAKPKPDFNTFYVGLFGIAVIAAIPLFLFLGPIGLAFVPVAVVAAAALTIAMHYIGDYFYVGNVAARKLENLSSKNGFNEYNHSDLVRFSMNNTPSELKDFLQQTHPDPRSPEFKAALLSSKYSNSEYKNEIKKLLKDYKRNYSSSEKGSILTDVKDVFANQNYIKIEKLPGSTYDALLSFDSVKIIDEIDPSFSKELIAHFVAREKFLIDEAKNLSKQLGYADDTDIKMLKDQWATIISAANEDPSKFIDTVEKYTININKAENIAMSELSYSTHKELKRNAPILLAKNIHIDSRLKEDISSYDKDKQQNVTKPKV